MGQNTQKVKKDVYFNGTIKTQKVKKNFYFNGTIKTQKVKKNVYFNGTVKTLKRLKRTFILMGQIQNMQGFCALIWSHAAQNSPTHITYIAAPQTVVMASTYKLHHWENKPLILVSFCGDHSLWEQQGQVVFLAVSLTSQHRLAVMVALKPVVACIEMSVFCKLLVTCITLNVGWQLLWIVWSFLPVRRQCNN